MCLSFNASGQIRTGIKAGANFSKVNLDISDFPSSFDAKNRIAFQAGLVIEFPMFDMFYLQSGIHFTSKGYRTQVEFEDTGFSISQNARVSFNYLEIPFNFTYKESGFIFYAGPYVAFGVGGKGKMEQTSSTQTPTDPITVMEIEGVELTPIFGNIEDADLGSGEDGFRGLGYGLNGGFGYEFGPFLLSVNYSYGLGDLTPKSDFSSDIKVTNRVISFGVTYFFNEAKVAKAEE